MNFEKFDDAPLETGQSLFLNKTLEVKAVFKPNLRKKIVVAKNLQIIPPCDCYVYRGGGESANF